MNTVDLLEEIGQNSQLKISTNDDLGIALDRLNAGPEISSSVLSRDSAQLEQILGANANVCCVQFPSDDEEGEEQPDEVPADDDSKQVMAANLSR